MNATTLTPSEEAENRSQVATMARASFGGLAKAMRFVRGDAPATIAEDILAVARHHLRNFPEEHTFPLEDRLPASAPDGIVPVVVLAAGSVWESMEAWLSRTGRFDEVDQESFYRIAEIAAEAVGRGEQPPLWGEDGPTGQAEKVAIKLGGSPKPGANP